MFISLNIKFSLKLIPFLLIIIFLLIKTFIEFHNYYNNDDSNDDSSHDSNDSKEGWIDSITFVIFKKIFYIFSFILYYFHRKFSKSENQEYYNQMIQNENKNMILNPILKVYYKKDKLKPIILIIFIFILTILIDTIKIKNESIIYPSPIIFGFITILFFNLFLFKLSLKKHKRLSVFLLFILYFPLFIYYCIFGGEIWDQLISAFFFIINSIKFCIYQYIMNNLFFSLYFIFFIEGICFFFNFIIINIIYYFSFKDNFIKFYKTRNPTINIINNFIHFILHLLYFYQINFYDSMNCMIFEIFSRGLFYSFIITKENTTLCIIDIVISFLSLISILIYEEIIILNFCGWNDEVKVELEKKEKYEHQNYDNISMIDTN